MLLVPPGSHIPPAAGVAPPPPCPKIGVVGPWNCDPLFSEALPEVAAWLVAERVNRDSSLDLGYSFEYVILHEDCQTSGPSPVSFPASRWPQDLLDLPTLATARQPRCWQTAGTKGFSLGLV